LDVLYGKQGGVREDLITDALREEKIDEKNRKIHLQLKQTLKKSREKYKARHDQQRTEKSFKVGGQSLVTTEQGKTIGSR
jgi:hypothetical protein